MCFQWLETVFHAALGAWDASSRGDEKKSQLALSYQAAKQVEEYIKASSICEIDGRSVEFSWVFRQISVVRPRFSAES